MFPSPFYFILLFLTNYVIFLLELSGWDGLDYFPVLQVSYGVAPVDKTLRSQRWLIYSGYRYSS